MSTKTAEQIFKMEFGNSRNFMTPIILDLGKINDNRAFELSKGTGIFTPWIFGVTVVDYDPDTDTTKRSEDSKCLHSLEEAREYIHELRNKGG